MRRSPTSHLAGALATLFLATFLGVPLVIILARSLAPGADEPFGAGFLAALTDPYYLGRVGFTLAQALLSTVLTVALGFPTALLLARYRFRGKRALTAAFTVPFVMPTVVAGIGFLALVGPRGVLGVDLRNTLALVLLAHVFYNFAVVARMVSGFLEGVAPRLEGAAATLGATPWRVMLRVTLPLAAPATLAAALLVFLFCFTSFGVVLILAPAPTFATLEVEVYRLSARLLDLDAAAALAVLQLALLLVVGFVYTRLQERMAVSVAPGDATRRPRGPERLLIVGVLIVTGALVLGPLGALVVRSLGAPNGAWPSARNYASLLAPASTVGFTGLWNALRNSLLFAGASATLALTVGFLFSHAIVRGKWRWLDQASLLPLVVSPVTLAFGYLLTYPLLIGSPWGVPIAHALLAFPFVTRTLLPAYRSQPPVLAAAAATLGAGPIRTLWRVDLPLLRPAFLTAAAFAFAVSLGEFGATLLLVRPEFATLPVAIFDRLGRPGAANYGSALALAVVLMALTAIVMLLLQRRGRSEF